MHKFYVAAIIALLVVAVTGVAGAEQKTFEKKFAVSPGGTLSVATDIGTVKVKGGSGSEVVVTARMEGRSGDIEKFVIEASQNGNSVNVTGQMPKSFWRLFGNHNFDVEFTITVPKAFGVRLQTSGGDVQVADLAGKVDGETSGGDVTVTEIVGNATLGTSGGDIRIEGVKGDIKAETSGGNVKIRNVVGNVDGETSGGNIAAEDVEGKVRLETSGGNVTIKVRGTNKGVHAETSGGNVTIMISKNVGATIDAGTSGGEVVCDLPVTVTGKISESHVKGTVNGGGEMIYAHTSGGNVQIKVLE
jgi:hypothetical protein